VKRAHDGRCVHRAKGTTIVFWPRLLSVAALTFVATLPAVLGTPSTAAASSPSAIRSEPLAEKLPPEAILGEWLTEDKKGHVRITKQNDGTYVGVLTWAAAGAPPKDINNKDPKLRERLMLGIVLMWHLRYDDGEYVDGYIYDPENGDTYTMKADLVSPDSLKLRGYVGVPLFGQSQTWSRL
jgi:uncharacterized protein (DUF2147 family)